jgi:hypothetical protein
MFFLEKRTTKNVEIITKISLEIIFTKISLEIIFTKISLEIYLQKLV